MTTTAPSLNGTQHPPFAANRFTDQDERREREFLASLFHDPAQHHDLPDELTHDRLTQQPYRIIFAAMRRLHSEGEMPTLSRVADLLRDNDQLADLYVLSDGGYAALARLSFYGDESGSAVGYVPQILGRRSEAIDGPVPLGQLLDRHKALREVVIDGLLRQSETMNINATTKVGKSWAILDLILAVATGGKWLGTFACAKGKVLLIDNELHDETLADRIRKVASARGIPLDTIREQVHIKTLRGKLRDVSQLHRLFEEWGINPGDYMLVVMDALYRFLPPGTNENANADMSRVYNWLDELADTFRTSIGLVHHNTKGDQSQKSVTDVGSGAGAISRATDTHLILRSHEEEDVAVMDVALRSFPPVPSRCFRWTFPTWNPADDLNPELLASPARKRQEQQREARDTKAGTELLTRLDDLDPRRAGYGRSGLKKGLGWDLAKFDRVVGGLVAESILEECFVPSGRGDSADVEGLRRKLRSRSE